MSTRQVLLGAVIVGIVGSLMALPWFLCRRSQPTGPQTPGAAAAPHPAGTVRYDSKTLEQWQSSWQNELKAEKKFEVFRAMTAFGTHGFGKEAAGTVIDIVREHCKELGPITPFVEGDRFFTEAHAALVHIGPPSSLVLLDCLKDADKNISQFGRIVKDVDLHPSAVPMLVALAHGDNPEWSAVALQALGNNLQKTPRPAEIETALVDTVKKGKHARNFLDVLQRVLAADKMKRPAAAILRALGPSAQPTVGTLVEALERETRREGRRQYSSPVDDLDLCIMMEALGKIQSEPSRVVPVLVGIAGNRLERHDVRQCAVRSLMQFGAQAAPATPMFIVALDDSIRCEALDALDKLGTPPSQVVPRLVQVLTKEFGEPAPTAFVTGATPRQIAMGNDNSIDNSPPQGDYTPPHLVAMPVVQTSPAPASFLKCSLNYLSKAGPEARDAVPVLVRIHKKIEAARPHVAQVLEKIGPVAQQDAQRLGMDVRGTPSKSQFGQQPTAENVRPAVYSATPVTDPWKPAQDAHDTILIPNTVTSRDDRTPPSPPAAYRADQNPSNGQYAPLGPTVPYVQPVPNGNSYPPPPVPPPPGPPGIIVTPGPGLYQSSSTQPMPFLPGFPAPPPQPVPAQPWAPSGAFPDNMPVPPMSNPYSR